MQLQRMVDAPVKSVVSKNSFTYLCNVDVKLVYIEWVDSVAMVPEWLSKDEAIEWGDEHDNNIIKQVGFVVKKTKRFLLLVSRISPEQVGGVFKIPIQCITKTVFLEV